METADAVNFHHYSYSLEALKMNMQVIPYIIPLLIGGTITVFIGIYVKRKTDTLSGMLFTFLMICVSWWSFAYALELGFSEMGLIVLWAKAKYIGVAAVPVAWCIFSLAYTGREQRINIRTVFLLFLIPVINILLIFSNELHHLFWTDVSIATSSGFSILSTTSGPLFWFHTIYSYSLILIGTFLIFGMLFTSRHLYFKQAALLFIGMMAPFIGNIIVVTGVIPLPSSYDITPLLFVITGISFAIAIFKFQFLTILPIAWDEIVENIRDAIFILDERNRIVDVNKVGKQLVTEYHPSYSMDDNIIGMGAEEIPSVIPNLLEYQVTNTSINEIKLENDKGKKYYTARITPLYGKKGNVRGRLVVLQDITKQKNAENALKRKITELETYKKVTVDRELRMIEMKKEMKELQLKLSGGQSY